MAGPVAAGVHVLVNELASALRGGLADWSRSFGDELDEEPLISRSSRAAKILLLFFRQY